MQALKRLDGYLAAFEIGVVASFATIALMLGVMQVVLRYVFNTGFHWTETIFTTLTIWAILLGGSRAVRDGVHARVSMFENILPAPAIRACNLLSLLASLALCSFFFYCGILYVRFVNQMGINDIETNIPDAITYSIVPIAMAAFALRYIILIAEAAQDPTRLDPPDHVKIEGSGA